VISQEINFDGLVGMTHCYGGLALGNIAAMEHAGRPSNPQQAALQGLSKMKFLSSLGILQAVLPPQERPHIPTLKKLGFSGSVGAILEKAAAEAPWLIPHVSASASMWTANSATVCPSIDSSDGHVHFTPANLASNLHRSIEAETTSRILKAIFPNPVFFTHHSPLPSGGIFLDEGAANHTRFCKAFHGVGLQLFVFGQVMQPTEFAQPKPVRFPARQTREASEACARLHQLYPSHAVFAHQHPDAIDAGVFHNDVISVGHQNVFLVHEKAFWEQDQVIEELKNKAAEVCDTELIFIEVKEKQISLQDAVDSYFFNSQIVSLPSGGMGLIAPSICQRFDNITRFLKEVTENPDNPIGSVHYVDLSQSMDNGGGPACLRLRVVLNEEELSEVNPAVFLTDRLYERLVEHVHRFYPAHLTLDDLADPELYERNCVALNNLTGILNLGRIYSFQT
jgi:succinylarginine dihydrolase